MSMAIIFQSISLRYIARQLWSPTCKIDALPAELLIKVLQLVLPPIDLRPVDNPTDMSRVYIKALFQLQLASRRWKEVLDTTPGVWALVSEGFPDHQNIANMDKSHNHPLTVYRTGKKIGDAEGDLGSCLEFLQLIESTRQRWRVLRLNGVLPGDLPHYVAEPAPILETIDLSTFPRGPDNSEVLTLFGHHVSTLRYVNMMSIAFHPCPSPFHDLISFSLYHTRGNWIDVEWIMEVLRGSPHVERLCLADMDLQMPTLGTSSPPVDLSHLKSFRTWSIEGRAVDYIIRRINTPNCIQFQLSFDSEGADDYDTSLLLDTALASFEHIFQNIIHEMPNPSLSVHPNSIYWGQHPWPPFRPESKLNPYFLLDIREVPFPAVIRWIDRVVDPTRSERSPSLEPLAGTLYITDNTSLTEAEIASQLKHIKSITEISTLAPADVGQVLQLLGEAGPEPWFPHLQHLNLHADGWEARELLNMARARSSRPSRPAPQLTIIIKAETSPRFLGPVNRVAFDPDTLREIRALKGCIHSTTAQTVASSHQHLYALL
ncbi:hypothetical protein FRC01_005822, partial [Tulasnella sp. 417]